MLNLRLASTTPMDDLSAQAVSRAAEVKRPPGFALDSAAHIKR